MEEGEGEENWEQADREETIVRDIAEEGTSRLPPSHLSQRCVEVWEGGGVGEEGTPQAPQSLALSRKHVKVQAPAHLASFQQMKIK